MSLRITWVAINTVEQMAHLKSVVAEAVLPNGYAVLNADDPLVAAMAKSEVPKLLTSQ